MVEELNEVLVRPATAADADAIATVHVASLRQAYADVVPGDYLDGLDVAARATTWRERLTSPQPGTSTWVAEEEGRVVAFASLGPSLDEDAERTTLQIYSIYLEPGSWGQGIARELMRTLLAEVPDGAAVTLWVPEVNERAAHFYRRNGFARDGVERLDDVGGTQLTEVRFRRG